MNCIQWIGAWRMIHSASSFDQLAGGPRFAKNKTVLVIIGGSSRSAGRVRVTS